MRKNTKEHLFKLCFTAVHIAIGLIFRFLSFPIPLFGANAVRVTLDGAFMALTAILFGPIYGATSYVVIDLLGQIIKPIGAYIPLITLVVALLGFLQGVFYKALKKIPEKGFLFIKVLLSVIIPGIICSVLNSIVIYHFYSVQKGLSVLIAGRLLEEVISCVIFSIIITGILPIIKKEIKKLFNKNN